MPPARTPTHPHAHSPALKVCLSRVELKCSREYAAKCLQQAEACQPSARARARAPSTRKRRSSGRPRRILRRLHLRLPSLQGCPCAVRSSAGRQAQPASERASERSTDRPTGRVHERARTLSWPEPSPLLWLLRVVLVSLPPTSPDASSAWNPPTKSSAQLAFTVGSSPGVSCPAGNPERGKSERGE
jgi:hypothetical protein